MIYRIYKAKTVNNNSAKNPAIKKFDNIEIRMLYLQFFGSDLPLFFDMKKSAVVSDENILILRNNLGAGMQRLLK